MNANINTGLTINELDSISCTDCTSDSFVQYFQLKKVPALISPNNRETILPVPVFKCMECGKVCKHVTEKDNSG